MKIKNQSKNLLTAQNFEIHGFMFVLGSVCGLKFEGRTKSNETA